MLEKIIQLLRAGFAALYLRTSEEVRCEALLLNAAKERQRALYVWSCTEGIRQRHPKTDAIADSTDPVAALKAAAGMEKSVVILRDFHEFFGDAVIRRSFRDTVMQCRKRKVSLIITAPRLVVPPEVEKDLTVVDFALPTTEELSQVLDYIGKAASIETPKGEERVRVLEAARGLTTIEAEDTFTLSLIARDKIFDPKFIARAKADAVKKSGLLEFYEPDKSLADIGGLDNAKIWLGKRRRAFTPEARTFGLPEPKGLLLTGIPGTGKSLTAKAASAAWQKPLLRLDVGRLFGSLVGESEANLRLALATAEAVSPCILWLDEIEKAFAQGSNDGGTSSRVFGSFLTWMQDKVAPVFVFATANDVTGLPPELLRKGRFDEIFFVDLPGTQEREQIWNIHLKLRNRKPENFKTNDLVQLTSGWTGAEIEQAVVAALFDAFDEDRELNQNDLEHAINRTVPLSQTMKERITALRSWAKGRAVLASKEETDALPDLGRAIEV